MTDENAPAAPHPLLRIRQLGPGRPDPRRPRPTSASKRPVGTMSPRLHSGDAMVPTGDRRSRQGWRLWACCGERSTSWSRRASSTSAEEAS
jgi:hypothetical protein